MFKKSHSSNIHTLLPQFTEKNNTQVLVLSFEHLYAMIIDATKNNTSIWEYFEKRKDYISEYPEMRFDCNELDLYYERR